MSPPRRPARELGPYDRPFWDHVATGRLHLQRCERCGAWLYPPGPCCPRCLADDLAWAPVAGTGRVVTWTTLHRQYLEQLPVPWTVVVAELPEGPLLVADLADVADLAHQSDVAALRIGEPVRLVYREVAFDDGGTGLIFSWQRGEP